MIYSITVFLLFVVIAASSKLDASVSITTSSLARRIESIVLNSPLLNHDFLVTFGKAGFEDMTLATKLFVQNHYAYSRNFPKYLQMIVDKLNVVAPGDSAILFENQEEEKGNYSTEQLANLERNGIPSDWVAGIPHPQLLRSFLKTVEVSEKDINDPHTIGANFTRSIIHMYEQSNPCEALAVIAFAIEKTVPYLYQHLWNGLEKQTVIQKKDYVFFPLHVLIDDGHADLLIEAFNRLLEKDPVMCSTAQQAVEKVLTLRSQMFTDLKALIDNQIASRAAGTVDAEVEVTSLLKADVKQAGKIATALKHPQYTLLENMAVASHILADEGHGGTMSGQFTCRDGVDANGKILMWTTPYGYSFEEMTPEMFIKVNQDMVTVVGVGGPNMAVRFHLHLYSVRPDVQCIVHTHPIYTSALAQLGVPLHIAHMDTMCFYDEVQFLPTWPGIPFGDEEGKLLEGLLGQKYFSALLEHHGLIVMGRTLEETIYRAYFFERAARLQLLTMSSRPIPTSSNTIASNATPSNKTVPVGQEILDHLPKTVPALSEAARDWRISDGPVKAHYYSWARVTIQKNKLDFMTK